MHTLPQATPGGQRSKFAGAANRRNRRFTAARKLNLGSIPDAVLNLLSSARLPGPCYPPDSSGLISKSGSFALESSATSQLERHVDFYKENWLWLKQHQNQALNPKYTKTTSAAAGSNPQTAR